MFGVKLETYGWFTVGMVGKSRSSGGSFISSHESSVIMLRADFLCRIILRSSSSEMASLASRIGMMFASHFAQLRSMNRVMYSGFSSGFCK